MPYYRVTHPNGLTEIMGEPTPQEEIEFLTRMNAFKVYFLQLIIGRRAGKQRLTQNQNNNLGQ
jgi:hypothetical protein